MHKRDINPFIVKIIAGVVTLFAFCAPLIAEASNVRMRCDSIFSEIASPYEKLTEAPAVFTHPLDHGLKAAIESHPLYATIAAHFKSIGKPENVFIRHYSESLDLGLNIDGIKRNSLGETIQAIFVKRVLSLIIPEAKFKGFENLPEKPHANDLYLTLNDSAEEGRTLSIDRRLEMSVVKSANMPPKMDRQVRELWRERFGIPLAEKTSACSVVTH